MRRLTCAAVATTLLVAAACNRGDEPRAKPSDVATLEQPPRLFGLDPSVAQANAARAFAIYEAKDYAGCRQAYERLSGRTHRPSDAGNAAACAALSGDAEAAFALLDRALAMGLRDGDWLRSDSDFASLHADPRWQSAIDRADARQRDYQSKINAELAAMLSEDQTAREGAYDDVDWDRVAADDRVRRAAVRRMLERNELSVAADYYSAALILQHGEVPADYELAHQLAATAAELDPDDLHARWLMAATQDRYLHSIGKPQIFGTQYRRDAAGDWTVEPFRPSAVTDDVRQFFRVRALPDIYARVEDMNADAL